MTINSENNCILRLEGVTKIYRVGETNYPALRGVDLCIAAGDFVSIAGPSGSGKSTLLNMAGCLDKPTTGAVYFSGNLTNNMKPDRLADLRNENIGFIFQSFNLIPVLTAYENVEFPLLLQGKYQAGERKTMIAEMFRNIGLEEFMTRRPNELSGGQQQRVAVARALIKKPKLILADEPTANLDSGTGQAILGLMKNLNRQLGTSFVFSTHDKMVMDYASRLIRLHDGEISDDIRQNNVQ